MIQRYHVMPTADHSWAVRVPGASRASKRFTYQEDAVQWAKDRAWVSATATAGAPSARSGFG